MDKTIRIVAVLFAVVAVACIAVLLSGAHAGTSDAVTGTSGAVSVSSMTIYFFYGEECSHCHNVMPLVTNLTKKYPDADIRFLEVWHNQTNAQIWKAANTAAGESTYGVPEVIYGTTALVGEKEIPEKLESLILDSLKKDPEPRVTTG
jgi:hypothetical protein